MEEALTQLDQIREWLAEVEELIEADDAEGAADLMKGTVRDECKTLTDLLDRGWQV